VAIDRDAIETALGLVSQGFNAANVPSGQFIIRPFVTTSSAADSVLEMVRWRARTSRNVSKNAMVHRGV
jgi:hypothetical protein